MKGTDTEAMKAAQEKLQQAGYKLAEVAYAQQGAGQAAAAGAAGPQAAGNDDGPIEADYEVVEDDKEGK